MNSVRFMELDHREFEVSSVLNLQPYIYTNVKLQVQLITDGIGSQDHITENTDSDE